MNKYFEWSLTDILLQHTNRMGHLDWNRPWWFLKSEKLGLYKPPFQISKQFWSFRTGAFNSSWVQSTSANASSSHKRLTVLVCYMCQLPQFIFFFFFLVEIFKKIFFWLSMYLECTVPYANHDLFKQSFGYFFICLSLMNDDEYRWRELEVPFTHAKLKTKKGTGMLKSYTEC